LNTEVGQFYDSDEDESVSNITLQSLLPPPPAPFPYGDVDDVDDHSLLSAVEQIEGTKRMWFEDGCVPLNPSTEHRERTVWKAAPSCLLIDLNPRFRTPVDTDLLPFQAGVDASSEEQEDYLECDLKGELVGCVGIELLEDDEDIENKEPRKNEPDPDDKYSCTHSTNDKDTVHLAIHWQEDNIPGHESVEVEFSDDEPVIEIISYY